jgi:hypothetical protein
MLTSNEIRAAMEWARTRDDIDIANEPKKTAYHMNTLAACVRELFEALQWTTHTAWLENSDWSSKDIEKITYIELHMLDCYRQALGGGEDADQ